MYKMFGYTDDLHDFEIYYNSYAEAVRQARQAERMLCVVFLVCGKRNVKF